jgi:SAM-dependent methyltransferase
MSQSSRKEAFLRHFDALAPTYRQYQQRYAYYWNDIAGYFNFFLHPDLSILEIGCGTGDALAALKGGRKVGIDFSPAMVAEARKSYPNLEFHHMDAESIQLKEKFDVIIFNNVIGYLDNVQNVFESVRGNCHADTKVMVSYYNTAWEPLLTLGERIGLKKPAPHQNWLNQTDISNLLYLAGFETYRKHSRMLLPFYLPVISWLLNTYLAHLPIFNLLTLNRFVFARPMPGTLPAAQAGKPSTTVVIPARNESGNIAAALERMPVFCDDLEVIFVEGNSTDDTWETIQKVAAEYQGPLKIRTARQEGKGKGDAVRKGYAMATGDILMILDADLTMPPEELPKFYDAIANRKGGFINGSRLVYPMERNAMRFLNTLGNKFFSKMFSWLLEQPIKDTLCGTKVMFREDYERLISNRTFFGDFDPFGDFDLLFGAYKLNLKIIDLPIRYRERTYGDTNISRFKHGWLLLKMCVFAAGKIKFR